MGRLMTIGSEWNYRQQVEPLSEEIAKVKAVSRESIEAALKRVRLSDWCEFRLLPE